MNVLFFYPLMIGTAEIALLAGLALLLFGGKKLPGLMKNMGQGVRQFKEGMTEASDEFKKGMQEEADKTDTTRQIDSNGNLQDNGGRQQ